MTISGRLEYAPHTSEGAPGTGIVSQPTLFSSMYHSLAKEATHSWFPSFSFPTFSLISLPIKDPGGSGTLENF